MLNDLLVLKRIKGGDIKAFEKIFRLYYSPLCLYAASITNRMEVAEEIVQEVFYIFWKDKKELQIFYSVKSYLYKAVKNRSLQYCQHQEVKSRYREAFLSGTHTVSETTPEEMMELNELQEAINRTLNRLPERRLRIFRMHRFEGKKYADIAHALSISVKTVEAEMTKALQTLRKEIEDYTSIL